VTICQLDAKGASAQEHRAINRVVALLDERRRRLFDDLLASQWATAEWFCSRK
jgi:hypothetical protein